MYPSPSGSDLTVEQAQKLDDTFLSSDPFGYFNARIEMMLRWAESEIDCDEQVGVAADDEQDEREREGGELGGLHHGAG